MGWISLVLVGTLFSAGSNIVDKKLLNGQTTHPIDCAASFGIVGLPVTIVGLLFLPLPSRSQVFQGIIAGAIFIPAAWLYYDVLAHKDVSRVVPLLRLSSLQTLLFGIFFLGEMLTERQWIAFFFLLISSMVLSINKSEKGGIILGTWLLQLLSATFLLAVNSILMAGIYRATSIWIATTWENLGMVICVMLLGLLRTLRKPSWWQQASQRTWRTLVIEQTIRLMAQVTTALAIAHGVPVALASILSNTNLVWVWLLAILFLKERSTRNELAFKCSGILAMSIGLYFLL